MIEILIVNLSCLFRFCIEPSLTRSNPKFVYSSEKMRVGSGTIADAEKMGLVWFGNQIEQLGYNPVKWLLCELLGWENEEFLGSVFRILAFRKTNRTRVAE